MSAWIYMSQRFHRQRFCLAIAGLCIATSAFAQDATTPVPPSPSTTTVERSVKGPTAKSIQVGVYLNVQTDCTSGTLPALRLITPPANGTISIRRGQVTATNYKQSLAPEV